MNKVKDKKVETVQANGAEIVVRALVEQGVEVIFGYPGGAVLPIYDALFQQDTIKHILCRHEQGCLHAAEAYGGIGLRAETVDQLDGVIEEMMHTDRVTIVDVCVDQKENCFPMIPSGKAHNEMILSPEASMFDKSLV